MQRRLSERTSSPTANPQAPQKEDLERAPFSGLETLLPERRLAEARLSLEHQHRWTAVEGVDERVQRLQLGATADDRGLPAPAIPHPSTDPSEVVRRA